MIYGNDRVLDRVTKALQDHGAAGRRVMEFLQSDTFDLEQRGDGFLVELRSRRNEGDLIVRLALALVKLQNEAVGEAFARLPEVKRG